MTRPITVLLADDHALVRRGFRRMLGIPASPLSAKRNNGDEALAMREVAARCRLVMDSAMPGGRHYGDPQDSRARPLGSC